MDAARIGRSTPIGTVALAAIVALSVAAAACDSSLDPDEPPLSGDPPGVAGPVERAIVGNVQYTAVSSQGMTQFGFPMVKIHVRARNLSDESVTVLIGTNQPGCHWRVRAYATHDMRAPAAYDDGRKTDYWCTANYYGFALGPGESGEQRIPGPAHSTVLGDSLPEGTYHFTVAFRPNDVPAIEVAAGAQELVRWTPPE